MCHTIQEKKQILITIKNMFLEDKQHSKNENVFFESKKEYVRTSANRGDLKSDFLKDAKYWY